MREDRSTTIFSENDELFIEGLKSDDCRSILANRYKNILVLLVKIDDEIYLLVNLYNFNTEPEQLESFFGRSRWEC